MKKQGISLESLPSLIAGLSAVILVFSVVYDYGFLLWLGVSLAEAPTTLSDHIRSSLVWAPAILLTIFFVTVIELLNRRVEQGMTEQELIATSPVPKVTAWLRGSPKYFVYTLAALLPVAYLIDVEFPLQAWMFGSIMWWFILHNLLFHHHAIMERTNRRFYIMSRWIPAVLMFVAFSGAIAAEKVPNGSMYSFKIGGEVKLRILARSYDNYFLLWNPDAKAIEFVARASVEVFQKLPVEKSRKSSQPTAETSAD